MEWIDTHCHLYAAEFDADRESMIGRAIGTGVTKMMLPNIDLESINAMKALSKKHPTHCFPMIGLHPCSVKNDFEQMLTLIRNELESFPYTGIGETGIDLYWDKTYQMEQMEAFEKQIDWALEFDIPVIIHSRESLDLNITIIGKRQHGRLKGIFHCFGGNYEQAMQIHNLGFKIGIGGVVTYKNSDLATVIAKVPKEMLVLETDAPYLSPVPYRGKRNESAYITIIAARVAEALGVSMEELAEITGQNASEVFKKNQ